MARPKHSKAPAPMPYHCGMCDRSFNTRVELSYHTADHADNAPATLACPVCQWPFPDSLALEQHQIHSGHGSPQFTCDNCSKAFISQQGLEKHLQPPSGCLKTFTALSAAQASNGQSAITCDRCPKIFSSKREYKAHRRFPNGECADHKKWTPPKKRPEPARLSYVDLDQPQQTVNDVLGYDDSSDTPDDLSEDDEYCRDCKTIFKSKARFNAHALRCSSQSKSNGMAFSSSRAPLVTAESSEVLQPAVSSAQQLQSRKPVTSVPAPAAAVTSPQARPQPPRSAPPSDPSPIPPTAPSSMVCSVKGCGKAFKSAAALKVHQTDAHGIGGKALDLHGSDSYMLNQRMREQLKAQGLLRTAPGFSRSRGPGRGRGEPEPAPLKQFAPAPPRATPPPVARPPLMPNAHHPAPRAPLSQGPIASSAPVPIGLNMGGDAEMVQAKLIQGKILRLLVQSDIFIHHDGKMTVSGIDWTRIGVLKQHDVVELFDGMCHLPKILQGEYLPPPTTFKDEYKASYPITDFEPSPDRDPSRPGLGVVALTCSKIMLANGCHEVVKVAAVDIVTSRILIDHLVCTDPHAQVADWRSSVSGISGWHDMEGARQAGYKIFKGWSAARSALWKFVDKETIIVGHNLRSDLDALRMIHGRAVDVAKVVEKAAKGPLSKPQLSLDSLSRNYPGAQLKSDSAYGRDYLMNAFAVRELGLWAIKNKEFLEKDAKKKSLDYQRVILKSTA